MRTLVAAALAVSLTASSAFAVEDGPLSAGKPAGVKDAQLETGGVLLVVGILAAAGAIAAIASTTQGNGSSSTSTAGTK
jgi:hypothetical protein